MEEASDDRRQVSFDLGEDVSGVQGVNDVGFATFALLFAVSEFGEFVSLKNQPRINGGIVFLHLLSNLFNGHIALLGLIFMV